MYLERRRRKWYALHDIPADLRHAIGKARFVKSLGTELRHEAQRRAAVLEAQWRGEIERARSGSADHIERDARYWRESLRTAASDEDKATIRDLIADEANERALRAAARAGVVNVSDPAFEDLPGVVEAERFYGVATGAIVKTEEHLEEYLATLKNEAKTVDMRRTNINRFSAEFPFLSDITRKKVQKWVNDLVAQGRAVATIRRALGDMRGYWGYLVSVEAASENSMPFEKLSIPKSPKKAVGRSARRAFTQAEVVRLLRAAELERGDNQLADLIRLAMWTGARIEELCALPVASAAGEFISIEDAKTPAGWRQVPIHSKLKPAVDRLVKESADGFILSGLSLNKYGDRSNAVGKRFGHMKAALGYGPEHVFHSIRKTVITLLEDAGIAQNVVAAIVGHEKKGFTFKAYSNAELISLKRAAIELIDYPEDGTAPQGT